MINYSRLGFRQMIVINYLLHMRSASTDLDIMDIMIYDLTYSEITHIVFNLIGRGIVILNEYDFILLHPDAKQHFLSLKESANGSQ